MAIDNLNRLLIALGSKIRPAMEAAQYPKSWDDLQYNNGYYQGLVDIQKLAQDIHNGRNGY